MFLVSAFAFAQPAGSAQPQGMSCEQMMMGNMRGMMSGSGMSTAMTVGCVAGALLVLAIGFVLVSLGVFLLRRSKRPQEASTAHP